MGQKQDIVHGISTEIIDHPTRTGPSSRSTSAPKLRACLDHSTMRAPVRMLEQGGLRPAWLEQRAAAAEERGARQATGEGEGGRRRAAVSQELGRDDLRAEAGCGRPAARSIDRPAPTLADRTRVGLTSRRPPRRADVPVAEYVRSCYHRARRVRDAGTTQDGVIRKDFTESLSPTAFDALVAYLSGGEGTSGWRRRSMEHAAHGTQATDHAPAAPRRRYHLLANLPATCARSLERQPSLLPARDRSVIAVSLPLSYRRLGSRFTVVISASSSIVGMVTAAARLPRSASARFDYWLAGPSGGRRSPRTTPGPRRLPLDGLLPGQHRPQGDRHPVPRRPRSSSSSSAGCWRCCSAPSSPSPGRSSSTRRPSTALFSVHASLMIFLFIIPAFAGLANLRAAADDRRAGHGVPAPERALATGCCRSPGS